jgi:cytochrome c oxidase subunit II
MQRDLNRLTAAGASLLAVIGAGVPSVAFAGVGQPSPWQKGLQDPVTEVAVKINEFHDLVNPIIIAITVFVLLLMVWVCVRFNERANPTPSRVTHNTMLEVAWTVIPILILIVIAIPSFKLLYLQYAYPKPDVTIKATANMWYWEHEYLDHDGFKITSNMIRDEELLKEKLGDAGFAERYKGLDGNNLSKRMYVDAQPIWAEKGLVRQLSVDNEIAVPEGKVVHMLVTASDVIHNWTIPSFGSKVDAVPGRVTATWFRPTRRGLYFGQCSELCGKDHASMPIAVRVVSPEVYALWADTLKQAKAAPGAQRRELINRARAMMRQAALEDGTATVKLAAEAAN